MPLIELVAQRFRVLGEPMRIKVLDRLRDASSTVGEL
jgi:DNA-binding transcriptional ArsR family regulator